MNALSNLRFLRLFSQIDHEALGEEIVQKAFRTLKNPVPVSVIVHLPDQKLVVDCRHQRLLVPHSKQAAQRPVHRVISVFVRHGVDFEIVALQ